MTGSYGILRMLVLSTLLHLIFLSMLSVPIKKSSKRIEFPSIYTVKLVPGVELGTDSKGALTLEPPGKEGKISKNKTSKGVKERVGPTAKELKRERSLIAKKMDDVRTTEEEIHALESRIRELRRQGLDVPGRSTERHLSIPGSSISSSSIDPELQVYLSEVWKRLKSAWGLPGGLSLRRDLETVVSVKIRRDGRIIGIDWEKKSGNRLYDESVLRTLRSVDPFPPFPQSIPYESIEIGLRFLPGELL